MLKIYGVPVSVHTRKVIVVALHKGLDHVVQPVVPVIPDSLPANWRSFSPTGLIPAMTDDGLTLADSTAICVYLDRQYPHSPLYPATTRDFARTLAFEQYAGHLFSELVRPLFHETVVHPRMRNIPSDQARIQDLLSRVVPEKFHYLDGELRGDWLVGNAPTVADIAVASKLGP